MSIPDGVTTIGSSAFYGCYSLTSVIIPDSVTTIGDGAFASCESLTSVSIGISVTTIGDRAFYDCNSLTSVSIPDSVTTIGEEAFYRCTSLTSMSIGNSVATIGRSAFYECTSLTNIEVAIDNAHYTSADGVLYDNEMMILHKYPEGKSATYFIIPDSVTIIGNSAFLFCDSLMGVSIPVSVTTFGNSAFNGCTSLTSVSIGNNVTTIGDSAFNRCESLTSVNIPDSVTSIGERTFYSCAALTSVSIGNSVTSIGGWAFFRCTSLTSVNIPDSVTTIGWSAFEGCISLTSATFEGNAPSVFGSRVRVFHITAPEFTIYFYEGATGFTTPTWYGYRSEMLPTSTDSDNDGWPDVLEIRLGMNQFDENSFFHSRLEMDGSGAPQLHCASAVEGCTYEVQGTDDLADPDSWQTLNVTLTDGPDGQSVDLPTPENGQFFYRVAVTKTN